jgi:hypothetical protein
VHSPMSPPTSKHCSRRCSQAVRVD